MKMISKILAGVFIAGSMSMAQAGPITGAFSVSGTIAPLPAGPMNLATGFDFSGLIEANDCVGDILAAVGGANGATCNGALGAIGDLNAGTFPGSGVVNYVLNVNDWITLSMGGVSFDLSAITLVTRLAGAVPSISISGTGIMQATGYDNTPGNFLLSTQGGQGSFSFSSTQISSAVPEPGSLALIGLGLVGLAGVARRRVK